MPDAPLKSDDLRARITIQSPSPGQDGFGAQVATWSDAYDVWAAIKAVTGKDIYALGSGFTSQVTHKIIIRYPGVMLTNGMRVLYGTRVFLVQTVTDPDERRWQLNLMCLEQNA